MKRLLISPSRCTGCRTCEIACAFSHSTKGGNPGKSSIRAFPSASPHQGIPVVCLQCHTAACQTVCPTKALERREDTGAIVIRKERCITCRSCVAACPFGNVSFDNYSQKVFKCDLCDGDPRCVQFCPTQTLTYY